MPHYQISSFVEGIHAQMRAYLKGYQPNPVFWTQCPGQNSDYRSVIVRLTLLLLNRLSLFFIPLKLELLTQIPASNDEKYVYEKETR